METQRSRTFPLTLYMVLGTVLGMYLGYQILPGLLPREKALPSVEQLLALDEVRLREESRLADALERLPTISHAKVSVNRPLPGAPRGAVSAVVTLTPTSPPSAEQVQQIADRAARELDGANPRFVSVYDHEGRHLNAEAQLAAEKRARWTGVAVNVAKILGVLAALIALRFVLQYVGRSLGFATE